MLSAYELNSRRDEILLNQTQILASKLVYAWEGDNVLPYSGLDFDTNKPVRKNVSSASHLAK